MLSNWEMLDSRDQMFALPLSPFLNTLVSGLHPHGWMVGAGYAGCLELADHHLIYSVLFHNSE